MGINDSVHYEILGRKANKWAVLDIKKTRKETMEIAKSLWDKGQYKGIKALKESFDSSNNNFTSLEIFSRGTERKQSKYDEAGKISPCLSPNDLYSAGGRRSIWDLMHNSLELWRITPTELLHNYAHYNRLYNAGTQMQNAVQRTAVSYEESEDSIQVRMRKIFKVIDSAVDILKKENKNFPSLELGRLKPIILQLDKKPNRTFLLTASIAEYLRPAVTLEDKMGRLAIFLTKNRPDWVMQILDQIISELLQHKSLLRELFSGCKNRGHMLLALSHFSAGQLERAEAKIGVIKFSPDMTRVNKFIATNSLPQTCRQLIVHLKEELASSEPLADDKSLANQFALLYEFSTSLEWLADTQPRFAGMQSDIASRQGRMINGQSISDHMEGHKGPIRKVHALLDLDDKCVGNSNSRMIANFILPILTTPENEAILLGVGDNAVKRMLELTDLQDRIINSGFGDLHINKLSGLLDKACNTILEKTKIIKKIQGMEISISERALKIIDMLAGGYFTYGRARKYAEQVAKEYLNDPEFANSLLEGQPPERHNYLLKDLKKRVTDAGLAKEE